MASFKCSFCGHTQASLKKVQYIYRHDGNFLIVNDVPCEECEYCGEQYFEATALKHIEADFQKIREGKKQVQHLNVPIEQFV